MNRVQETIDQYDKKLEITIDTNVGTEIEAHGKKWIVIKSLYNNCFLAIGSECELPCTVSVVCKEENIDG